MMDILVSFLVDRDDMDIASMSGLDMGSSRFAVHGYSSWKTGCEEGFDERQARSIFNMATHILQWGTTLQLAWPEHSDMELSGSGVVVQRHTYRQMKMLGDERLSGLVWMKSTERAGWNHAGPQVG
jgi:hypothetical protein